MTRSALRTVHRPPWQRVLALELCLCCLAIVVCVVLCLAWVPTWKAKARGTQQFFEAGPGRLAVAEQMAETGEPPASVSLPLGMRPAWPASEPVGNLLWLCGERQPPAGWLASVAVDGAPSAAAPYSVCREGVVRW